MQTPINNQEEPQLNSPFVNRFLTKGFLSGKNEWWMYLLGILTVILGYTLYGTIVSQPLSQLAIQNGVPLEDIKKNLNIIFNPEKVGINSSLMLMIMMGMFLSWAF